MELFPFRWIGNRAALDGGPASLLVIFTGESNSGGAAPNASLTITEASPREDVKILNVLSWAFQDLDIGTNNNLNHSGLSSATHGWENELANAVAAGRFSQSPLYLVQTGQGASKVSEWQSGDSSGYWTEFVARYNSSISLLRPSIVTIPIVWMSIGINDALYGTSDVSYQSGLEVFISQIRSLIGESVPVILTLFEAPLTPRAEYNAVMQAVASGDPYTYAVSSAGAESQGDGNHWTYVGYKLVAQRLIDATFLALGYGQNESPSISPVSGEYSGTQAVSITGAGTVKYTTDGSDPLIGTEYSGSFNADPPITISARAISVNKQSSNISSAVYTATTPLFSPASLSPDMWFDASDPATMFQERTGASATTPSNIGDPVGSWKNKGSAGGWATASSDAVRPLRQSDGSLLFDGIDDKFNIPRYDIPVSSTFYRAFNRPSSGVYSSGFANIAVDVWFDAYWYNNNNIYLSLGSQLISFSAGISTGAFVVTSKSNISNASIFFNGTLAAGPTAYAFDSGYVDILCNRKGVEPTTGKVYQMLAFSSEHNDTDRALMEAWLSDKNGASL